MEWISVNEKMPLEGYYLVSFLLECFGSDTPFEDRRFYARGYFDPETGWSIENKYILEPRHATGYWSLKCRVTHWMPLPTPPKGDE